MVRACTARAGAQSLGLFRRSTMRTSAPMIRAWMASVSPVGPAPTTSRSVSSSIGKFGQNTRPLRQPPQFFRSVGRVGPDLTIEKFRAPGLIDHPVGETAGLHPGRQNHTEDLGVCLCGLGIPPLVDPSVVI